MPFPAGANVRPSNLGQPFLHKTRFPPLPNLKDIQRDPNLPKENVPKPIPDAPRSQGSIPKPPPPQSAAPPQAAPQSPPTPQVYAEPPPRPPGSVPSAPPSNNINTGVGVGAGGAVGAVSTIGGVNPVSLGIVAGTIWISNSYQLLKLWRLSQPESKPVERELYGGNKPNTYYTISGEITEVCATKKDFSDGIEVTWYWENAVADGNFGFGGGPLAGVIELKSKPSEFLYGGHTSYGVHFKTGDFPDVVVMSNKRNTAKHVSEYNRGFCRLIKVSLIAQPIGEAPVEKPQPIMQQSPPQRIPSLNNQPPSNQPSNQPQLQLQQPPLNNFPEKPPYAEPTPQSRQQPIKIAVPPNQPIQISSPNSPPILISPPQPNQPSNINISNNQPTGQPRNITINQPGGNPVSFSLPGANPLTINIPGQKPITINPGQAQPANTVKPLLDPTTLVPEPITGGSTPIKNSTTPLNPTNVGTNNKGESVNFKPQPKPSFQPQPQPKPIEEPEPKPVDPFFPFPSPEITGIAALTPILQQLLSQTNPQKIKQITAEANCEEAQPDGCIGLPLNNLANNLNNLTDLAFSINDLINQIKLTTDSLIDSHLPGEEPEEPQEPEEPEEPEEPQEPEEPEEPTEEEQAKNLLLERIYNILGGDNWFNSADAIQPTGISWGENTIKEIGLNLFGEEYNNTEPLNCLNLIQLMGVNNAINYYRQGLNEFPANLPPTLISTKEPSKENINIQNSTKLFSWYVERFDEIVGQFEIPIEIKDADASTPGEQPQSIRLPNLAEAIAEMFTLSFQSYINSETILNLATRNLIETGMDKKQNFVTYKLLQSMTDWVGFKQRDIKLKLPLSFTLNKTRYDEILQESEVDVNCVEFDDKFGLEADMMRFREAAGILQAVHKRKLDPNGDIKGQILQYLLNTFKGVNKVNGEEIDLEKLFTQIENGFTDIPTVGDPTKPYGRPFTQRPKIRNLNDVQPPTQT